MANPQKENGFTAISNELFEKIYQSDLTLREMKIIFAVIRFTDGFHRNATKLSLRFLSQATNINYRHTQSTVSNLISKNVLLIVTESSGMRSRQISLNKNYDLWNLSIYHKSIANQELDMTKNVSPELTASVNTNADQKGITKNESETTEKVSLALTEKVSLETTKKVSKKENIKKTLNKTSNIFSFPTELKEVKGFGEIWNDWVNYRKEIKKPLTPTAIKRQLNKLLDFKSKGFDIISIIDTSINRHWQDFFEPKENGTLIPKDNTGQTKRITDGLKWLNPDLPGWM